MSEYTWTSYVTLFYGWLFKKKLFGWIHAITSKYVASIHLKIGRFFYPHCSKIICVANGVAQDFEKLFPTLSNKVIVINNPIDTRYIALTSQEYTIKRTKTKRIIAVGRLVDIKRFDLAIAVHEKLLEKHITNELVIVGDGPCKKSLEKLIRGQKR